MKKIVISLLLLFTLSGAQAQIGTGFGVNMFLSADAGASMYSNRYNDNPVGFSGGISVGKWILTPLAFRVGFDFKTIPSTYQGLSYTSSFAFADAAFLWDFTSTFFRTRNWRINVYPMIGLGLAYRAAVTVGSKSFGTDHEFQTMLGLHVPVRIGNHWDIFAEYKCRFLPEAFDGSNGDVYLHSLTGGFTCRFANSPFNRRTEYESRGTDEDWFFGVGIGPNFSSFTFTNLGKADMYGVAPEVMFGRNYSNFWTIRFQLGGLTAHEPYDTINDEAGESYTFSTLHADLMVNLTHALKFRRGKKLNVLPYLGAGAIWRYDDLKFDMAADAGIMFRYYVGIHSDFYVDLKYTMVTPRIGGGTGPSSAVGGSALKSAQFWVGLPSLTVGYIYNFGHSTTRYRLPAHWCAD